MSVPPTTLKIFFFTSQTCGPCKAVKPVISELEDEYKQVLWTTVDTAVDPNRYATTYKITHVPTMVAVSNGTEIGRHSGTQLMGYFSLVKRLTTSLPK